MTMELVISAPANELILSNTPTEVVITLGGAPGPKGDTGTAGAVGVKGDTGQGDTGAHGDSGPAGNTTLSGHAAPAADTGADGDFYIDIEVFFGC